MLHLDNTKDPRAKPWGQIEQLIDQARTIAIEIIAKDPKLEKLPELREELNALEADERSDFIEKA
jgi:hypothetical protein